MIFQRVDYIINDGGDYLYQLLIVDDEYEIRIGLANYYSWKSVGFEIAGLCCNGQEALDFMKSHYVHAVLCDIKMPVMDGLKFSEMVRVTNQNVKIVFLSGYKDFDYVQKALRFHAYDYILKPTCFDEITRIFEKIQNELDLQYLPADCSAEQTDDLIDNIQKIVQNQLPTVTLETVSKEVYLDPTYISKLFKRRTGGNFSDYVTECRMNYAADLLKNSPYAASTISEMIGYSNPKNFIRAFKKYYGVTPSIYKTKNTERHGNTL